MTEKERNTLDDVTEVLRIITTGKDEVGFFRSKEIPAKYNNIMVVMKKTGIIRLIEKGKYHLTKTPSMEEQKEIAKETIRYINKNREAGKERKKYALEVLAPKMTFEAKQPDDPDEIPHGWREPKPEERVSIGDFILNRRNKMKYRVIAKTEREIIAQFQTTTIIKTPEEWLVKAEQ